MRITSLQNPRIKHVVQLRQRRVREQTGCFLVDGWRELARAIACQAEVVEVYFCPGESTGDEEPAVLAVVKRTASACEVTPAVFGKIGYGDRRDGVVAIVRTPCRALTDVRLGAIPLVVVMEAIEKPGNLGAVLRTADAVRADAVIAADAATDLYNPNTVRSSLGTIFSVPVGAAASGEVYGWLQSCGLSVFAACVDGAIPYTEACLSRPCAIVLGSESRGLSAVWRQPGVTSISLPMRGVADSLNVSTTAAVLLYEALRQRCEP